MKNFAVGAAVSLVLGCGDGSATSAGQFESVAQALQAQAALVCDCYQEFGYLDRDECEATQLVFSSDGIECAKQALQKHDEAAFEYMTCIASAAQNLTACYERELGCGPDTSDALQDCGAQFSAEQEACPLLPPAALEEFGACETLL